MKQVLSKFNLFKDVNATALRSWKTPLQGQFLAEPTVNVSTLSNGLRVATENRPGQLASVGVYLESGSRYEAPEDNGVAHFLEHMFFKGTKNRSRTQLELEIENMGGHLNAYTSREMTAYYATVLKNDVSKALDILADVLQNSTLDSSKIEVERDVILREMQSVESTIEEVVFDRLHEAAYLGSSLGATILGPRENILRINQEQLRRFIDTHYTAPRMVIVGAGPIDHEQLVREVESKFSSLPHEAPEQYRHLVQVPPAQFVGSDLREQNDDMDLAHVAIALEAPSWTDPDSFAFMVLQAMLGNWDSSFAAGECMSSPMCSTLAKQGIAASVSTFNTFYNDTGLFGLYLQLPKLNQELAVSTAMKEMVNLCFKADAEAFFRAKAQLKTAIMSYKEGSGSTCEHLGRQMLAFGRPVSMLEIVSRIDSLEPADLKRAAERFIWDREVAISAIGPIHELPQNDYIRRRTFTHWA